MGDNVNRPRHKNYYECMTLLQISYYTSHTFINADDTEQHQQSSGMRLHSSKKFPLCGHCRALASLHTVIKTLAILAMHSNAEFKS